MRLFFLFSFLGSAMYTQAQHTGFLVSANSGFFTLRGPSTEKVSTINLYSIKPSEGYTNNPFSSNLGAAYGLSGQVQRVTKGKFVFGGGLGYEILQNNMDIDGIYDNSGNAEIAAKGHSTVTYQCLNLNPYIGYRFDLDCLQLELTGGLEWGKPLKAHEKGSATDYTGRSVSTSVDRRLETFDFRERLQVTAYYKKTGLTVSYSNGLSNYLTGWVGGTTIAFSRVLRIGLTYKIN